MTTLATKLVALCQQLGPSVALAIFQVLQAMFSQHHRLVWLTRQMLACVHKDRENNYRVDQRALSAIPTTDYALLEPTVDILAGNLLSLLKAIVQLRNQPKVVQQLIQHTLRTDTPVQQAAARLRELAGEKEGAEQLESTAQGPLSEAPGFVQETIQPGPIPSREAPVVEDTCHPGSLPAVGAPSIQEPTPPQQEPEPLQAMEDLSKESLAPGLGVQPPLTTIAPEDVADSVAQPLPPSPESEGVWTHRDPPEPAQVAPPVVLWRHTDVSFPSRVRVGKPTNLRIRIAVAKRHQHDVGVEVTVPAGEESVAVTVYVAAENFSVEGDPQAILSVPREGDSHPVTFRLVGESVGSGRIMVDFSQEGRPLGSVDLLVEVVADEPREAQPVLQRSEVRLRSTPERSPEVILTVHEFHSHPGRLHFTLFSPDSRLQDLPFINHGDLGSVDLHQDIISWVGRRLASLNTPEAIVDEERALADAGNRLYDAILPEQMKMLCWTLLERKVRTILVLSDEPHIPWELIKPYRQDTRTGQRTELPFWGEAFALGRWLRGPAIPSSFALRRVYALATGSGAPVTAASSHRDIVVQAPGTVPRQQGVSTFLVGLPSASKELEILSSLMRSGASVQLLPARRAEVLNALQGGGFDLLHIASHGHFAGVQDADTSSLVLEDGIFAAADLPSRLSAVLRGCAPLIFFNACYTGRVGYSLTALGGWGAELIRLGCGGFIGTLWRVTDEVALDLTQTFYRHLFHGIPIAEALCLARLEVRQRHPRDPTWLAYSCFADPNARRMDGEGTEVVQEAVPVKEGKGSSRGNVFPPVRAVLEVIEGPNKGERFELYRHETLVAGRSKRADLKLMADPHFSRRHFQLHFHPPHCTLRDLGSINGTLVNNESVKDRLLKDGDMISGGRTRIRFSLEAIGKQPSPPIETDPQVSLPGYRLVRKIHQPGEGETVLALRGGEQHVLVRSIKLASPISLARQEKFVEYGSALCQLRHRFLLSYHDIGVLKGGVYLVSEYLEPINLRLRLRGHPSEVVTRTFCTLICQVLEGLQVAHQARWIHGAIHPSQVVISIKDGFLLARLGNIGLVQLLFQVGHRGAALSQKPPGEVLFLAPEQVAEPGRADARSDLYSMGATLYFLLSGKPPHEPQPDKDARSILLTASPVHLGYYCPQLPPQLIAVIHKALDRDPGRRFTSAREMSQALLPFTGHRSPR